MMVKSWPPQQGREDASRLVQQKQKDIARAVHKEAAQAPSTNIITGFAGMSKLSMECFDLQPQQCKLHGSLLWHSTMRAIRTR